MLIQAKEAMLGIPAQTNLLHTLRMVLYGSVKVVTCTVTLHGSVATVAQCTGHLNPRYALYTNFPILEMLMQVKQAALGIMEPTKLLFTL